MFDWEMVVDSSGDGKKSIVPTEESVSAVEAQQGLFDNTHFNARIMQRHVAPWALKTPGSAA